ncbi:formylmethanofuran dehydrogenase subunit B [Bartonella silvatica]|uniref:Formylmethanofuran dehydrogenase subunit B n=1 Tax=Bartonella silvatica TaxID=357760 RepID=A0ABV2HHS2_9HYPH
MAPRLATITQPAIARALREAKKQGCELIEIKPTGELLIYLKTNIPLPNSTTHQDKLWNLSRDDYDFDIVL